MTGQLRRSGWMDAITGHARASATEVEDREIVQPELFALLQRMTARLRSSAPLGELLSGLAASICGALETEIDTHCEDGRVADSRLSYRKMYSGLERAIIAYQSRRGG